MPSVRPGNSPQNDSNNTGKRRLAGVSARAAAVALALRAVVLVAATTASVIAVGAVAGRFISASWTRLYVALGVALLLPLIVRWAVRRAARRRGRTGRAVPRLGSWFVSGWNIALVAVLCLGLPGSTGRALRRRGDWLIGRTEGWLPRRYRGVVNGFGRWLEGGFGDKRVARVDRSPGVAPPDTSDALPAAITRTDAWVHPLPGAKRWLPPNAFRRFGAPRLGHNPRECLRGHCGVDLLAPKGTPVVAAGDGVVIRAAHDPSWRPVSGRHVKIRHEGGIVTAYVHLDSVRADLRVGTHVRAGELLGTLGQTGVRLAKPHLHFAVQVPRGRHGMRWLDPEPLLWLWRVPTKPSQPRIASAQPHHRRLPTDD